MDPIDGVPLRATASNSNAFTSANNTHTTSVSPMYVNGGLGSVLPEIPKRESIPSASDLPSHTSPQPVPIQSAYSVPGMQLSMHSPPHQDWHSPPNGNAHHVEDKSPGQDYMHLYNLKQAQLEAVERSHKDVLDEVLKAREKAEQLAEKIQNELREEVRSIRKIEEGLRDKLDEKLRQERSIWTTERDLLLQKIRHLEEHDVLVQKLRLREQEIESLTMQNEHLKSRVKMCQLQGCSVNTNLSPGLLDEEFRFRSPSGRSFSPSGRSFSPSAQRSFSPSGRIVSPPIQQSFSPSPQHVSPPNHMTPGYPTSYPIGRSLSPSRAIYPEQNGHQTHGNHHVSFPPVRPSANLPFAQEVPYDPPPTVVPPLSPPPMAYRKHAGHTPAASMSSRHTPPPTDSPVGANTPTQRNFVSLNAAVTETLPSAELLKEETLRKANESHQADLDALVNGDIPLKGPLGLKPDPQDSTLVLEILNRKLGEVSKDPDVPAHQPAIFQRGDDELSVISDGTVNNGDYFHQEAQTLPAYTASAEQRKRDTSPMKGDASNNVKKADDEPIPLRLKPSMNFGAPLGQAVKRHDSASSADSDY